MQAPEPLLDIPFEEFESRWDDIVKHLSPKYLIEPELRKLNPDFGFKISRLGMTSSVELFLLETRLGTFAKLSDELYSVTVNIEFAAQEHCVSFDFTPEQLPKIVAGLPPELAQLFLDALTQAPFQACSDLLIEVDLRTHLGEPVTVEHETFVPLVIDEVLASRFHVGSPPADPGDIPSHIFRLSKAFKVVDPDDESDA